MVMNAVAEAKSKGKKILFVLNSSGPQNVSEFIEDVDAMMWVYYAGQEGGKMLQPVSYLARFNPSGKLPLTYPKRYQDTPTYGNFPGCCGEVWYGEGIYVGYRWYDKRDITPLFPFGHGLSYTSFELYDLKLSSDQMNMDANESVEISIMVKNTGLIAGKEVVQLYVSDEASLLPKPIMELKGFKKIKLETR